MAFFNTEINELLYFTLTFMTVVYLRHLHFAFQNNDHFSNVSPLSRAYHDLACVFRLSIKSRDEIKDEIVHESRLLQLVVVK